MAAVSPQDHLPVEQSDRSAPVRWSPSNYALLSALFPGLGQFAQRRYGMAFLQFATVTSYLGAAIATGAGRALWFAVGWNAWSAIDAYLRGRD